MTAPSAQWTELRSPAGAAAKTRAQLRNLNLARRLPPLCLTLALLSAASAQEEWPSFRGDVSLTGVARSELPDHLSLLWSLDTAALSDSGSAGLAGIESTAAIASGKIFTANLDGNLHALALADGRLLWTYATASEIKSSPAVAGNTVFFGDEDGRFHAVDIHTGARRWLFQAEGALSSSPNFFADECVLFGSYDNHLYCLSPATGELVWKHESAGFVHASPALADSSVIVAGCDGLLRLLDARNGNQRRSVRVGTYVGASCAVLGTRGFVGTFGNEVVGIDLTRAETEWRYQHPRRQFPFYSSPAVTPQVVVVGGRDKLVHAIDTASGDVRWLFAAGAKVDSSPVIVGDRVFLGATDGRVLALDLKTGVVRWQFDSGSSFVSSPAVAAGRLVIGSDEGVLYCFGDDSS